MAREPHPLITELAELRREAGWSPRAASLKAGLGPSTVQGWEKGLTSPTLTALGQYMALLGRGLRIDTEPAGLVEYLPVTPQRAARNRQVLADALGIVDDMPTPRGAHVRGEAA